MHWYLEVLKKYAQFDGRARRKEYWFFALFNCLIGFVIMLIASLVIGATGVRADDPAAAGFLASYFAGMGIVGLYSLAVLIPGLAVTVRRLHDTNRSGWWILISFVPVVGGIILLIFMLTDSQPGPNQYGPNPKGVEGYGGLTTAASI
jgi:uncharacterized membrane protein YhaH (DUF805 family)